MIHGRIARRPLSSLGRRNGKPRELGERGLLRGPRRWKPAEFKIGDNFVRALIPTKTYAAVLAASNCAPIAIPINKRRYVKGGREYPVGIDKRGRLRVGDLKKS